jgi:hypothetical protein
VSIIVIRHTLTCIAAVVAFTQTVFQSPTRPLYPSLHSEQVYVCVCVYVYRGGHICVAVSVKCVCVCMYVCVCICVYVCVCVMCLT